MSVIFASLHNIVYKDMVLAITMVKKIMIPTKTIIANILENAIASVATAFFAKIV